MTVKELLLEQFSSCYDYDSWFVAAMNAVTDLNVEQAAWKPTDDVNCIWETLSHLTYYNHAYLERFKGVDFEYDVSSNNETFSTGEYTEADWRADVERFRNLMDEWRGLIAAADEAKFDEAVPQKEERKWWQLIADVNSHNAYHAGQILLLRKLQGSWNPDKGVS